MELKCQDILQKAFHIVYNLGASIFCCHSSSFLHLFPQKPIICPHDIYSNQFSFLLFTTCTSVLNLLFLLSTSSFPSNFKSTFSTLWSQFYHFSIFLTHKVKHSTQNTSSVSSSGLRKKLKSSNTYIWTNKFKFERSV